MEVVVLPPQDCLKRHQFNQRRLISPNKPRRHSNPNPNPNPTSTNQIPRSNRRRRSSNSPPPTGPGPAKTQTQSTSPAGQIRILKRGEGLPESKPVSARSEVVRPVMGPMIGRFYAGSACVTSPAPSELPLPAFFTRSCGSSMVNDDVDNNQKIASDLRRVLKLF